MKEERTPWTEYARGFRYDCRGIFDMLQEGRRTPEWWMDNGRKHIHADGGHVIVDIPLLCDCSTCERYRCRQREFSMIITRSTQPADAVGFGFERRRGNSGPEIASASVFQPVHGV